MEPRSEHMEAKAQARWSGSDYRWAGLKQGLRRGLTARPSIGGEGEHEGLTQRMWVRMRREGCGRDGRNEGDCKARGLLRAEGEWVGLGG